MCLLAVNNKMNINIRMQVQKEHQQQFETQPVVFIFVNRK